MEGSSRGLDKREAEEDLETKPIPKKHKEVSEQKEEIVEGVDQPPYFVMSIAERKKTLFLSNLCRVIKIKDIIYFFKNFGKVVQVRLVINETGKQLGYGFVEFSSSEEAKKAQETMNGRYLCGYKISLAKISPPYRPHPRPMYCIEYKFRSKYQDFLKESFPIEEEETLPHLSESISARENTLLIANLSPQTRIEDIFIFFEPVKDAGLRIRLIVNLEGKHVGYGFAQFTSAEMAKKALYNKGCIYLHDHKIFLVPAERAQYSPRLEYSLAEKLWYEDYLLQESFGVEEYETLEAVDETPSFVEALVVRKRMLHVYNISYETEISDIIEFFKDVGEVVHVRRVVSSTGNGTEHAYVVFASADEAKKAQEQKHCTLLCGRRIMLGRPAMDPEIKYCIDHKVWYEDYLRRKNLLIEEDEAVDELDETHDFSEEVAARKRTLFMYNLRRNTEIRKIINYYKDVGEVLSVRLNVDDKGRKLGCGFIEFASASKVEKALEGDIDYKKFLKGPGYIRRPQMAPYPIRPRYNLAEKQWCDKEEAGLSIFNLFCGKKKTFSEDN